MECICDYGTHFYALFFVLHITAELVFDDVTFRYPTRPDTDVLKVFQAFLILRFCNGDFAYVRHCINHCLYFVRYFLIYVGELIY